MSKYNKYYLLLFLVLLTPNIVYATTSSFETFISVIMSTIVLTPFVMIFYMLPLSQSLTSIKVESQKIFKKLFIYRLIMILSLFFINYELIYVVDVLSLFIGPIVSGLVARKKGTMTVFNSSLNKINGKTDKRFCTKCGAVLNPANKFCVKCGDPVEGVELADIPVPNKNLNMASVGEPINYANYPDYALPEALILTNMIKKELENNGVNDMIVTPALNKRKNIMTLVYSLILFICLSLIFFHAGTGIVVCIFIVSTIIYVNIVKKYSIVKLLEKEAKSRPDEKISYIVSTVIQGQTNGGSSKVLRFGTILIAIVIPLLIFSEPRMIFEKNGDDYVLRFYTLGAFKNDKKLEIPGEYKDGEVVGIRGDVFKGVWTIEEIVIPDTVQEIRGGAFMNMSNLEHINIPDGVPEIKGNTFENCTSLKEIEIPDSVVRIGGSAFRENDSLEKVTISKDSKLKEIGSSAFRGCDSLDEIYLPADVKIDSRSFKESPTVVRKYSDSDYDVENSYKYESYKFLTIGEKEIINEYRDAAILQEATIELIRIDKDSSDNNIFVLEYVDNSGRSKEFNMVLNKKYVPLNQNVAFEVKYSSTFNNEYATGLGLDIYFN